MICKLHNNKVVLKISPKTQLFNFSIVSQVLCDPCGHLLTLFIIEDGAIITLGATTLILHTPDGEE